MEIIAKEGVIPFLSFTGNAEEALNFYADALPGAKIESIVRYSKEMPIGEEGKVLNGVLSFNGGQIMFLDMDPKHPAPAFSWAVSLFVPCGSEEVFDTVFSKLSKDGFVMMGPESVAHIRKCAWITDKFGVTWQPIWE